MAEEYAVKDVVEDGNAKKNTSFFSRIWNGLFRLHGDDFEQRLKYISKEEATLLDRMKRRSLSWRATARNLIFVSVILEVVAVAYAIMTTRTVILDWKLRALRVLPIFLLPVLSSASYWALLSFTKMRDSRDQKSLERLRAERQEKIDELKERTNYYTTQQLIQRYDTDPAAKAAAASVLASKLGADSGLKMFLTDNFQYNPETTGTSNDIEPVKSAGLRRRNPSDTTRSRGSSLVPPPIPSRAPSRVPSRGTSVVPLPQSKAPSRGTSVVPRPARGSSVVPRPSRGSSVVPRPSRGSSVVPRPTRGSSVGPAPRCYDNEMVGYDEYNMVSEACSPSEVVVEHEDPAAFGAQDGGWIARVAALLVGEDPTQSYALICGNCHMHNGLAMKEDFPVIAYYCPHCHALNRPRNSDENVPANSTLETTPPTPGTTSPVGEREPIVPATR